MVEVECKFKDDFNYHRLTLFDDPHPNAKVQIYLEEGCKFIDDNLNEGKVGKV